MKPRILVVEDEPSILDNIVYSLETEGFQPQGCATGGEARAALERGPWALVVLDVGLPDTVGFDLCKEIRRTSNLPIIFLTARASEVFEQWFHDVLEILWFDHIKNLHLSRTGLL